MIWEMFIERGERTNTLRSHLALHLWDVFCCIEISWVFVFFVWLEWCLLTHACVCFGGWSGAMLPSGRDSNGIPPVRRTPDGVLASCINGIFDDALSLHNISSRSICTQKMKNEKQNEPEIEPYRTAELQFKSIKSLNLSTICTMYNAWACRNGSVVGAEAAAGRLFGGKIVMILELQNAECNMHKTHKHKHQVRYSMCS